MNRILKTLAIFAIASSIASWSCTQKSPQSAENLEKVTVELKTTQGPIRIKLFPKEAPITASRFVELVRQKFYDGQNFFKVEENFIIQAGDPTGTGFGGSGKKIPGEFNHLKHAPGVVGMARGNDPNSADSQFYITLASYPHLDGLYVIFGQVVEGLEIAQKIKKGDKIESARVY